MCLQPLCSCWVLKKSFINTTKAPTGRALFSFSTGSVTHTQTTETFDELYYGLVPGIKLKLLHPLSRLFHSFTKSISLAEKCKGGREAFWSSVPSLWWSAAEALEIRFLQSPWALYSHAHNLSQAETVHTKGNPKSGLRVCRWSQFLRHTDHKSASPVWSMKQDHGQPWKLRNN